MKTHSFGATGVEVPIVGQGTWEMERDPRNAVAALRRGIDLGMTHIDTAEMYGSGRVEELVAEAIEGRRDEVFLVSKVLPTNASRGGTVRACENSLRRLKTDRLDGYLLHWEGSYPLEDTVAAFEQLRAEGKIRSWGVSNFDERAMQQVVAIAGAPSVACNQVCYHIRERAIEHDVMPYCRGQGIAIVAYSPFGSGSFPSPGSPGGRALADIAATHGVSPHAIALAFLCRDDAVFAIPKSARVTHVEENALAGHLALDRDEIAGLDAVFPLGPKRRTLPMI
jgi:diketogulonate reductase-like aldo/keto reductase